MVNHFFTCVLLLVLQASASICAVISPPPSLPPNATALNPSNITTPLDLPEKTTNDTKTSAANATVVSAVNATDVSDSNATVSENITAPLNVSEKTTNSTKIVPTNATDVSALGASNITAPLDFPDKSVNGTKIYTINATADSPNLSVNSISTNATDNKTPNLNDTLLNATKTESVAPNSTAYEIVVVANENPTNKTDTEVAGLLDLPKHPFNETDLSASPPNKTVNGPVNKETELIDDGQNTEDTLRNCSSHQVKAPGPGVPLVQGQLAAILAGVFVTISIVAYVALLSWRRFLENRYGNREMLVNEDDFNDRDDLRHFSL